MGKVSKMKLKDILDKTGLILRENDIIYFCKNINLVKKFMQRYIENSNERIKIADVEKFILENEQYINKEKLLLLIVYNYRENLDLINYRLDKLKDEYKNMDSTEAIKELIDLNNQLQEQKIKHKEAVKLGRGMDEIITFYYYDKKRAEYRIKVVDSKEIIDNKPTNVSKALKRFDEIDSNFKNNKTDYIGIEYAIQSILLTDLLEVFPNRQFGTDIRTMILENQVLKEGIKTQEDLENLKIMDMQKEYENLIDGTKFENILPNLKKSLREYVQYIDLDKLLLISAYRFNEKIENQVLDYEETKNIQTILDIILENLSNPNVSFVGELQKKVDNEYLIEEVVYSTKDIKKCLSQFAKDTYLSSKTIQEYKEKINNGDITLLTIPQSYIDILYSQSELEKLASISTENLIYIFERYNWDTCKILDLYKAGTISLENIKVISEKIKLSDIVSFEELNLYYKQIKENPENEDVLQQYNKYLKLYKELKINNKAQEEIQIYSNQIIEDLILSLNGHEYLETVKNYYKEGIITLNSIVEWNNKTFIMELFDEGLISLEQMQQLALDKKIPIEDLNNIYHKLIDNADMEYDERLRLLKSGFVKEHDIFDLYKKNLIFEKDLEQLAEDKIIRKEKMKKIINNRTMEELEKNSAIRLTGLNVLTKKNNENHYLGRDFTSIPKMSKLTGRFIIDPNERERFIQLLRAYKANTDLDEDSPFYNYEFYVIPDDSGTIGLNSVVIAERYYQDKDTQRKFAMNNATYFFKYKDLMVLSNLRKSEMTKERQNIVFTANHVIANEKRDGCWATSIISSIAKTMLSSDLKEYNKKNQRKIIIKKLEEIYDNDELMDIISMAVDIDKGEYTREIEEIIVNFLENNIEGDSEER